MSPLNNDDLHRIFEKLDQNGDGFVSLDELKCLLERIGVQTSTDELEQLVGKTSLDLLNFVCFYDTIIKANIGDDQSETDEKGSDAESNLAEAFKVYDLNGDGVISCEELQSVLSQLGMWDEHGGRDCKSMIGLYDMNSDGVLDFEEFKNMMVG
ncbi:Calcium-binding protein CML44 [Actinidia chinensis var. chinensis]|uniref:Calcium-binding protein CML44 n=1 Tax=Actinidia chinensis var. chinensis TaxID=1590841 RepID=A0A2R6RBE6_ACTCC|nr:Calcium-binding protein CML44 [Actinidia chinensis var. chinensis]